jgi:hypothetical protein
MANTAPLLDLAADARRFTQADAGEIVSQLRPIDLMAISGCRYIRRETGITLPVRAGYSVTIDLAGDDTYTVRRVFRRGGRAWVKGEARGVYCEQLSETAYRASCYVNVRFGGHDPS